jgi:hypothetical protein
MRITFLFKQQEVLLKQEKKVIGKPKKLKQ